MPYSVEHRSAVGTGITIVSLLLIGLGVWLIRRNLDFVRHSQSTTGKVVDMQRSSSGRGGRTYFPVIEFQASTGPIRFKSNSGSSPPAYAVGEEVTVNYREDAPQKARINSRGELLGLPALVIWFGLCSFGLGWVITQISDKTPIR